MFRVILLSLTLVGCSSPGMKPCDWSHRIDEQRCMADVDTRGYDVVVLSPACSEVTVLVQGNRQAYRTVTGTQRIADSSTEVEIQNCISFRENVAAH